jgi:arylformamidase
MTPKLWDISPPVHAGSPVFPGDTPFSQAGRRRSRPAARSTCSAITLSPHVGAHADAPLHYDMGGATIGQSTWARISALPRDPRDRPRPLVRWDHVAHAVHGLPPRVLVRTYAQAPVDRFDPLLAASRPRPSSCWPTAACSWSASTPPASTRPTARRSTATRSSAGAACACSENLVLDDVPEGDYELIALPLKLVSADASPVRAVLREWRNPA